LVAILNLDQGIAEVFISKQLDCMLVMEWISVPLDDDTLGAYYVLDPDSPYRGRTYGDYTSDWLNWFLSADADKRTSGPVVFLRSKGVPLGLEQSDKQNEEIQQVLSGGSIGDVSGLTGYSRSYSNDPNIRIGGDRLQITEDQAVFVPIIVAYWLKSSPYADWGGMQDRTGLTIDYGDNPPQTRQLTINGQPIEISIPPVVKKYEGDIDPMERFRISTSVFTAIVPDAEYGRSSKDFIEETPVAPNNYAAMVDGYFVMLKFKAGVYWINSWATAPREARGPYFSELLYQLEVGPRKPLQGGVSQRRPPRFDTVYSKILETKTKEGDLTDPEIKRFKEYVPIEEDKKSRRSLPGSDPAGKRPVRKRVSKKP
jgi:hypothetical protein